jgi:hypothetical protein
MPAHSLLSADPLVPDGSRHDRSLEQIHAIAEHVRAKGRRQLSHHAHDMRNGAPKVRRSNSFVLFLGAGFLPANAILKLSFLKLHGA